MICTTMEGFHRPNRLLTYADRRLGRRNIDEITSHPVFNDVHWKNLSARKAVAFFPCVLSDSSIS